MENTIASLSICTTRCAYILKLSINKKYSNYYILFGSSSIRWFITICSLVSWFICNDLWWKTCFSCLNTDEKSIQMSDNQNYSSHIYADWHGALLSCLLSMSSRKIWIYFYYIQSTNIYRRNIVQWVEKWFDHLFFNFIKEKS